MTSDIKRQGNSCYSLGKERVEDVVEMTRIASGLEHDEFFSTPRLFTNINSSPET